MNFRLHLFYF